MRTFYNFLSIFQTVQSLDIVFNENWKFSNNMLVYFHDQLNHLVLLQLLSLHTLLPDLAIVKNLISLVIHVGANQKLLSGNRETPLSFFSFPFSWKLIELGNNNEDHLERRHRKCIESEKLSTKHSIRTGFVSKGRKIKYC